MDTNANALFFAGEYDRIVFHFDGNNNDPDDIAAMPIAALIAKAAGIEDKIVFYYNNNIFEPSVDWQVQAMDESAAFAESLGIETVSYEGQASRATESLTSLLNSGEKILILEGGPMTATSDALEGVDSTNLENITLLQHSDWNRNQGVKWDDLKADYRDVTFLDIADQNGFTTLNSNAPGTGLKSKWWNWLDDPDDPLANDPIVQEANQLMANARPADFDLDDYDASPKDGNFLYYSDISFDASDAGMLMYALHGLNSSGNESERSNPLIVRDFIENGEPLEKVSSDGLDGNEPVVHQFKDGWVKIEAESATWQLPNSGSNSRWQVTNEFDFSETGKPGIGNRGPIEDADGNGATGAGAVWYTGPNRFEDAGLGRTAPLLYRFEIGEEDMPDDGPLRIGFNFRVMKPDGAGVGAHDAANDIWFKWGEEGTFDASIDTSDWRKAHVKPFDNQGNVNEFHTNEWAWLGHTASGGKDVPLQYNVSEPGIYEFAIGARSQWIAIDQIQIVQIEPYGGRDPDREESETVLYEPEAPNLAPELVDDVASVTAGKSVVVDVLENDSDPDADQLTVTIVEAPSGIKAVIANGQIEISTDPDVVGKQSLTYTVSDGNGNVSTATLTLDVAEPEPVPTAHLELGTETVFQEDGNGWFTVSFAEPIKDAVVVMGPVTWAHGDSAFARVTEVTEFGFKFQIDEWEYMDGARAVPESVGWMAASAGAHTLPDGTVIQAGSTTARNEDSQSVSFSTAFENQPVVFSQVASFNGSDAATTRNSEVTTAGFSVRMQEEDARSDHHAQERIDWIAVEKTDGILDTGNVGTGFHWSRTDVIDFSEDQVFIADLQTERDSEAATLRYKSWDGSVSVRVHEDQSEDWEQYHRHEKIGYLTAEEGSYELDQLVG
ncbi:MAG: Ig-like domain-containing protein [Pseudomonadota bacterium]